MGSIRLGKRTENRNPLIKDFVQTVYMNDLVFTGWDINQENVYDIALKSKVLKSDLLEELKPHLQKINVLKGVFDKKYVRRLNGNWVKSGENKLDLAKQVMADIGITETALSPVDNTLKKFNSMLGEMKAIPISEYIVVFGNNDDILVTKMV